MTARKLTSIDICSLLRSRFPSPSSTYGDAPLDEVLVDKLLSNDPKRLSHVLGVVRTAHEIGASLGQAADFIQDLRTAALFHDIGYAVDLRMAGFHPLDGAIFMAWRHSEPEVVSAILFHTAAASEVVAHPQAAPLYRELADYANGSLLLDALTFSDLRTSPSGELITIGERVRDIAARYGTDHTVTRNILAQTGYFQRVLARVLDVVAEHAVHRLPWLFIDIDDTLVPAGRDVSEEARQALAAYAVAGGRISLASGKHPYAIKALASRLHVGGTHIAGNGAVAVTAADGTDTLLSNFDAFYRATSSMLAALNIPYAVYTLGGIYIDSTTVTETHVRLLTSIGEPLPTRGTPEQPTNVFKYCPSCLAITVIWSECSATKQRS